MKFKVQRTGRWGFSLAFLLCVVAVCAVASHVYQRKQERTLIENWTEDVLVSSSSFFNSFSDPFFSSVPDFRPTPCPKKITKDLQLRLLVRNVHGLDVDHQQAVLQIIAQQFRPESRAVFKSLLNESTSVETRKNLIRLIALHRYSEDAGLLKPLLDSPDPEIRAAAIDGIGWIHQPNLTWLKPDKHNKPKLHFMFFEPGKSSGLRVELTSFRPADEYSDLQNIPIVELDDSVRSLILNAAINDEFENVRTAAKTALMVWPRNKKLRFAEWGVWINDGGQLQWLKSIVDEIPPFVHQITDSVRSLEETRMNTVDLIDKPVIHVTVDQPAVFSVGVMIEQGKVWFAYPKPDDFQLGVDTYGWSKGLSGLEPSEGESLDVSFGGYTWVSPVPPRKVGPISGGVGASNRLGAIGIRWNQVLAMPKKPDGWAGPAITAPIHQWWSDLRDVECSWVENRGEHEKFLYYDGPTNKEPAFQVSLQDNLVTILHHNYGLKKNEDLKQHTKRVRSKRNWLFVSVKSGVVSGLGFESNLTKDEFKTVDVGHSDLHGEQVFDQFIQFAMREGLNIEEAKGMANCWRKSFFETDGQRILCFLNRQDYDSFCPLEVTPKPTELARCGVVLTEFQPTKTRDDPDMIQSLRDSIGVQYQLDSNGLVRSIELDPRRKSELENVICNLEKLSSLKRIKLSNSWTGYIDKEIMDSCMKVQTLEELDIPIDVMDPAEMSSFSQIKKLTIRGRIEFDDLVDLLTEMKSLKVVRLVNRFKGGQISFGGNPLVTTMDIEKRFPNHKFIWD